MKDHQGGGDPLGSLAGLSHSGWHESQFHSICSPN